MTETVQNHEKPRFGKKLLWLVCLLIGLAIVYVMWGISARITGFLPPEMAMAQYTPKDVIGDLGGMKVRIPRHYAEYVTYDDDPGFGEKRKGGRPERTFDSRLRSFVTANVNLTHRGKLKLTHLYAVRMALFWRADAKQGGSGGNQGIGSTRQKHSRDSPPKRGVAQYGEAVSARFG